MTCCIEVAVCLVYHTYYATMEFDFSENGHKILNFLKCLGDFSNLEQFALIQSGEKLQYSILFDFWSITSYFSASDKRIKDIARVIALIRSGRILIKEKRLYKRISKYATVMIALKLASKHGKSKEKANAFREILKTENGLLNLLGIFLETSMDQFKSGVIQIDPIIGLPRVIAKKRQPRVKGGKSKPLSAEKNENKVENGEENKLDNNY